VERRRPRCLDSSGWVRPASYRTRCRGLPLSHDDPMEESGHRFTTEIGTPGDPSHFPRRFAKVSMAAGIEQCHPHELRHTAASLMLSRGVPLHIVADVLGHSSISVTKDVYGHLVAGERRLATDAIAQAIYGA
jgi:integrase